MNKETLLRYQENKKEIIQIKEEIKTIRARLEAPKTQSFTGMPTAHGGNGDPLTDGIAAIQALTEKYEKKLCELCAEQLEIETAISRLKEKDRILLRYRYIQGLKWETICTKMGKTEDCPMEWGTVHYRHRRALRKLQELS